MNVVHKFPKYSRMCIGLRISFRNKLPLAFFEERREMKQM